MTKDNKTVSTIRRRKGKQVALALQKIKEETPPAPFFATEEEETAKEVEDNCFLFDERVLGSSILRRLMSRDRSLFLALVAIRCVNALVIQTHYVPDEYWQSIEISHNMAFGYGYKTWEWNEGIRGYSYPLVFAVLFKFLQFFGLDSRLVIIKMPRIVQGIIAGYGDFRLYKLSSTLCDRATAQWALLCQVLSWFNIYCSTRTLSSSTEMALVTAALSYFPWPGMEPNKKRLQKFLILAALSVIVRPTAVIIWILMCSWHLQTAQKNPQFQSVLKTYLTVGVLSLGCSSVIDRIWYEQWTSVHLNFLVFNVFKGGASIYGTHPWHWYLSQGVPAVIGSMMLPFVVGAWKAKNRVLLWLILWIVGIYSFLPHKEFRFIMPIIPMAMHFCGVFFQQLCSLPGKKKCRKSTASKKTALDKAEEQGAGDEKTNEEKESESKETLLEKSSESSAKPADSSPPDTSICSSISEAISCLDQAVGESGDCGSAKLKSDLCDTTKERTDPESQREKHQRYNLWKARIFTILLAVTNIFPALYFCLIHQRGTIMVTKFLADAASANPQTEVLFLMPCHSTPYYSYIHQDINMRFLTCEPNLQGVSSYREEADIFFHNPNAWLRKEYVMSKRSWPSHIVYYGRLHKEINSMLVQAGYKLCDKYFHTHFPEENVDTSILVSCR